MVAAYLVLLCLLAAERLVELRLSARNARWALQRGGLETGQRHFLFMKALHAAFFVACAAEVLLLRRPFIPVLGYPMLALAVGSQGLRYWAIATLGRRWNVRVITVPGLAAIDGGPYRFLRHPNYLAVVLEGVAVPLVHAAWLTALAFTVLNAALLWVRIRCEEAALRQHNNYGERLGDRRRLIPRPLWGNR